MVAKPTDVRPRIAPVVGMTPEAASRLSGPGTEVATPLPTRHPLPHAVHRLEDAAADFAKVAEATTGILHTVGLHVEGGGGGGGGHQGGGAEPVQLGEEALTRTGRVARRPETILEFEVGIEPAY